MVALVTLEETKSRLRIDHNDDDTTLEGYIEAASGSVINYLKGQAEVLLDLDSGGDLPSGAEVPAVIQTAVILLVGYWYDPIEPNKDFERGYLPMPVTAILYPLRDPALA